jgi:biopolymer transport protein ExbD
MKFRTRPREPLALNITPLIDVVFLLLIFFMVTTTFNQNTQLEVHLPGMQTWQTPVMDRVMNITVNAQGQIAIEGKLLPNPHARTLREALQAHPQFDPTQKIILRADGHAPYQMIARVMDVAGQLGYQNIQLLGDHDA